MRIFLISLICVMSAGCTSLGDLRDFTLADAQLALTWASKDGDILATTCYAAVVDILSTLEEPEPRDPIGAISSIYLARSIRKDIHGYGGSGVREKFLLGCAPLMIDQRNMILKFGLKLYGF